MHPDGGNDSLAHTSGFSKCLSCLSSCSHEGHGLENLEVRATLNMGGSSKLQGPF